jgi:hypothetical protein
VLQGGVGREVGGAARSSGTGAAAGRQNVYYVAVLVLKGYNYCDIMKNNRMILVPIFGFISESKKR